MRKRKGFTIIELVIVIAVIGVLAAVLLPGFRHAVDRANAVNPKAAARAALMEFLAGDRQQAFARDKARPVYLEVTGGDCFLYSQEKLDGCDGVPQPGAEAKTVFLRSPLETGFDPETDALTVWRDGDTAYVRYPAGAFGEDTAITTTVGEAQEFYELTRFAGDWSLVDHWEAAEGEYRGYPKTKENETDPLPAAVLTKAVMGELIPKSAEPAPVAAPNFLDGQTTLTQASFTGYTSLTKVTIPASLKEIAANAFYNMRNLTAIEVDENSPYFKSVDGVLFSKDGKTLYAYPQAKAVDRYDIPDGVTSASSYAFTLSRISTIALSDSVAVTGSTFIEAKELKEFIVGEDNPRYIVKDGVLFSKDGATLICYPRVREGASYTVPDGVTKIGSQAFRSSFLTEVTLPDSVKELEGGAFFASKQLSVFHFSENLEIIGDYALATMPLEVLTLPEGNGHFVLEDGALFNAEKTVLIRCLCGIEGEYQIPDTVKTLSAGAFSYCKSLTAVSVPNGVSFLPSATFNYCAALTQVVLPESLSRIGNGAFWNCKNLAKINISKNMTSIDSSAFSGCTALTEVTYSGTQAQWDAITIGSDNDILKSAEIICTGE